MGLVITKHIMCWPAVAMVGAVGAEKATAPANVIPQRQTRLALRATHSEEDLGNLVNEFIRII